VDGEDEIGRARLVEAGGRRRAPDEPAERFERPLAESELERGGRRLGERLREGSADRAQAVVVGALASEAVLADERVRAARLFEHRRVERLGVVRAEEPPGRAAGEGEVEQRLVPLALGELGRRPLGPDRLADPAHAPPGRRAPGDELAPGRDDAGRVRAHLGHVREPDTARGVAELLPQQADLGRVDDDERGLVGLDRVAKECARAAHEVVLPRIEERFVAERHRARLYPARVRVMHSVFPTEPEVQAAG